MACPAGVHQQQTPTKYITRWPGVTKHYLRTAFSYETNPLKGAFSYEIKPRNTALSAQCPPARYSQLFASGTSILHDGSCFSVR